MSEKQFRVRFEQEDGRGEIVNEKGVELTARELVDLLNEQQATISVLKEENDILKQKLRKNYIANKQYEEMKRLQEENEQLRQEIVHLKDGLQYYKSKSARLEEELLSTRY